MHWDATCDVLVIGSGAGGFTGAYLCARAGLSVMLLESSERFGGTSAYSGGGMWLPGNAVLCRAGADADVEAARRYYHAVVGETSPRALQDAYIDNGARLIDALEQDPLLRFMVYPWPDYYGELDTASATGRHIVPAPLAAETLGALRHYLRPNLAEEQAGAPLADELVGGQALIGRLLLALTQQDTAHMRLQHQLTELVQDQGRVVGAIVQTPQGLQRVAVRHGVLLATGGFERNAAMRAQFGVPGHATDSMAPASNQGAGIRAGMAVGGDVALMDQAWWSPGLMRPDGRATFTLGFDGGVFVNQNGQRFINESLPYDRAGRAIIEQQAQGQLQLPYWLVYDDSDHGQPPLRFPNLPVGDLAPYRAAGLLHSANTVAELAALIGVPADALQQTIERNNAHVQAGTDSEFGRGQCAYDRLLVGDQLPLRPITQGPFHAMAFGLSDLGTKGGLRTDTHARVLRSDGQAIEGLYATGNTMAAASGHAYPGGGNPVGSSMVFAFLAAQHLLQAAGRATAQASTAGEASSASHH